MKENSEDIIDIRHFSFNLPLKLSSMQTTVIIFITVTTITFCLSSIAAIKPTYRYGSQESSAFLLLFVDKLVQELHEALFALEVSEVGQRLQRLGH